MADIQDISGVPVADIQDVMMVDIGDIDDIGGSVPNIEFTVTENFQYGKVEVLLNVIDTENFQYGLAPVPGIQTTLNGALSGGEGTITVVDTSSFPSVGKLQINNENDIQYTGKTATTFTGVTGLDSAHADASTVDFIA